MSGRVTAAGLVMLAAAVAGCGLMGDAREHALDSATAAVRAAAEEARAEVEATLRDPGTGQEQPVDRAARVLLDKIVTLR